MSAELNRHAHPTLLDDERLLEQCQVRRGRRSGPGGQHRNKVETAVTITHQPSGVSGDASERRSQAENRRMALFRLRLNLALNVRCPPFSDQPTAAWLARCRGGRIQVSAAHADFPVLLAESLDTLAETEWDAAAAAQRLGVSRSQLTRFLKREPRAFQLLNHNRTERGLRPLQ